jgi:hypothetical protein
LTIARDQDNHIFRYSNLQRLYETKRLKYQRVLLETRRTSGILKIEKELSTYNSRTCDLLGFQRYMTKKIEINERLYPLYVDEKYRRYQWYGYLNRLKSEANLIRQIRRFSSQHVRYRSHRYIVITNLRI